MDEIIADPDDMAAIHAQQDHRPYDPMSRHICQCRVCNAERKYRQQSQLPLFVDQNYDDRHKVGPSSKIKTN